MTQIKQQSRSLYEHIGSHAPDYMKHSKKKGNDKIL